MTSTRADLAPRLTGRQRDVLALVARGRTNPEIAAELGIGFETVKMHVSDILAELGVASREEAAAWWRREHSLGARAGRVVAAVSSRWLWAASVAAVALGGVAVALVVGRGANDLPTDPEPETPGATSTNVPAATPTVTATATPAGVALPGDIQATIDAAMAGDGSRLTALLTLTQGPCVVDPAPAILPPARCPAGVAAGAPVPAIVLGICVDEPVGFLDPAVTFRLETFRVPEPATAAFIGVVEVRNPPLRYAALFGFEKPVWLGFDEQGHLIGEGGGSPCPAFDLRPRLASATWLSGPLWPD